MTGNRPLVTRTFVVHLRDATAETSNQAREAILLELQEWVDLDKVAPDLAVLRDHLSAPQQGKRII